MGKEFFTVVGNLGKDPQTFETRAGEVLKFTVAEPRGYDKEDTRWWQVATFNAGLIARAKAELYKGATVALAGFGELDRKYNDNVSNDIVADRLGLVEMFAGTKKGQSAPQPVAATGGYSDDI